MSRDRYANMSFEGGITRAELVARSKRYGAMHARNWKQLRKAERDGDEQQIIRAATYAVGFYGNGARLPQTIRHVFKWGGNETAKNPNTFWPILIGLWDGYDGAADWKQDLIRIMDDHDPRSGLRYMTDESRAFYNQLPDVVKVYRGCARKYTDCIAWTTDRATAAFFAARTRYDANSDPVIATGHISVTDPKLYFASADRGEFEIVSRPTITKIEPQPPDVLDAIMEAHATKQKQTLDDLLKNSLAADAKLSAACTSTSPATG
jgi:hypothetical protein